VLEIKKTKNKQNSSTNLIISICSLICCILCIFFFSSSFFFLSSNITSFKNATCCCSCCSSDCGSIGGADDWASSCMFGVLFIFFSVKPAPLRADRFSIAILIFFGGVIRVLDRRFLAVLWSRSTEYLFIYYLNVTHILSYCIQFRVL
jgi:hypothetical protein